MWVNRFQALQLDGLVDLSNCRLVSYNPKQECIEMSFEGKETEPFSEIMTSLKLDLLLEIKKEDYEFEVYHPGGKFNYVEFFIFLLFKLFLEPIWSNRVKPKST